MDGVVGAVFFSINIPTGYTHFCERPYAEKALPSEAASAEHKIGPMRELMRRRREGAVIFLLVERSEVERRSLPALRICEHRGCDDSA